MAISRAQLLKELLPGLNAIFGMEYRRYENEHTELYEVETSDRSFEEEVKVAGFGMAPNKTEGAGIVYDTAQELWVARFTHETIAMGFSITEEAMEDNLYDSLSSRYTKALARSMAYTKQIKAMIPVNNGFSSFNTGDGVTFFNTAHPLGNGGSNSNRAAVDLNETALENAAIAIAAWTDERGLLINARIRKLIVPPALMFTAKRIIDSDLRVGTSDNDLNAMKSMGTIPEGYRVNHFITDTNSWYLRTDIPNGMKHFQRAALKTKMEDDFETGNAKYKARERYSFGVSDPLCMYASPGSS